MSVVYCVLYVIAQDKPLSLSSLTIEWARRERKTYMYLFKLQEQHAALQAKCDKLVSKCREENV